MIKHIACIHLMIISSILCGGEITKTYNICDCTGYSPYLASLNLTFNEPQLNDDIKVIDAWIGQSGRADMVMIDSMTWDPTHWRIYMPNDMEGDLLLLLNDLQKAKTAKKSHCFIRNTSTDQNNHCKNVWFKVSLKTTPDLQVMINHLNPYSIGHFFKLVFFVGALSIVLRYAIMCIDNYQFKLFWENKCFILT